MPDLLESADPGRRSSTLASSVVNGPLSVKEEVSTDGGQATTDEAVLYFENVSKWYGPVIGVNQVTLELRPGITGLVGANGAGKSTLLRLAAGQLRPDLGSVQVCGREAASAAAKHRLGYCPELDIFYEEMSGRRFVETMARLQGFSASAARCRTEQTLELVGMADRANRRIAGYSKGMRQRIKLAQALIHDPPLLILDEPLSGIDPIGRRESIELFLKLAEAGKCLLVSSHELEELEKLTDHVAIMAYGRIAAVGPLVRIRDLLDNHPLSILVASDQNRKLAMALLDLEEVVGVEIEGDDRLKVLARQPRRFFQKLADLVLEEHVELRHLETLDDSTHAILGYLLGAGK
ncbi:MAG: ABC transporter ATP-binding protein [Planctomycetes bacterium]|nr:ABC transporter ATP-binding protein [Planctomycetota bacterium]